MASVGEGEGGFIRRLEIAQTLDARAPAGALPETKDRRYLIESVASLVRDLRGHIGSDGVRELDELRYCPLAVARYLRGPVRDEIELQEEKASSVSAGK